MPLTRDLYIIWSDRNNIGIPILDEQHRSIVATINSLYYFVGMKRDIEVLAPTIEIITQYTRIHFRTEEAILADCAYPDLDEHMQLHQQLVAKMKQIAAESNESGDTGVLLKFLKDWWLDHINVEDIKYAPFVLSKIKGATG